MKNINSKGLGYLAVTAVAVAVAIFIQDASSTIIIALGGLWLIGKDND